MEVPRRDWETETPVAALVFPAVTSRKRQQQRARRQATRHVLNNDATYVSYGGALRLEHDLDLGGAER